MKEKLILDVTRVLLQERMRNFKINTVPRHTCIYHMEEMPCRILYIYTNCFIV